MDECACPAPQGLETQFVTGSKFCPTHGRRPLAPEELEYDFIADLGAGDHAYRIVAIDFDCTGSATLTVEPWNRT